MRLLAVLTASWSPGVVVYLHALGAIFEETPLPGDFAAVVHWSAAAFLAASAAVYCPALLRLRRALGDTSPAAAFAGWQWAWGSCPPPSPFHHQRHQSSSRSPFQGFRPSQAGVLRMIRSKVSPLVGIFSFTAKRRPACPLRANATALTAVVKRSVR